ncbi:MAG: thiamine phosphate synthase [Rubrobacteraceae bacterium]
MNAREILWGSHLILVTDPRPDLAARVAAGIRGGVDIVQLRDKHTPMQDLLQLAGELKEACDSEGALFTVNDDATLARLSGASCVHLGQEDGLLSDAREALGPDAVIGRSVGATDEALEAIRDGADYLGAGAIYGTPTKPEGEVAGLTLIRDLARAELPVPWFAIGGTTLETAGGVAAAGAPGFAVVRAVLDAEDPEAAARELRSHLPDAPA